MTAKLGFLRRATNYPGGISAGGGDTGFDTQPQKTILLKKVSQSAQDVILPKGTVVLSTVVMPDPDAPAVAGTVTIKSWNIATNAAIDTIAENVSATSYSETIAAATTDDGDDPPVVTGLVASGTMLAADTRYRITPTNIGADTAALAGFEVVLPRIRI